MTRIYNRTSMKERRRQLRHNLTPEERLLWSRLRHKRILGIRFWRQYSVGRYVLDFYAPAIRLAIELDGMHHMEHSTQEYDNQRNEYITSADITVIRFQNKEILHNMNHVIVQITRVAATILSINPIPPK
jgi:very-short-patch-repair endonuclease